MKEKTSSMKEWRRLYDVAVEFKKLECWDWMYDDDLFGVQNPDDGEIGYCCIMGNFRQMFGIAVYLGADGLDGYLKIQSGEIGEADPDALYCQKCIMASFENRDYLWKEDLQLIKKLGLKFRGRNQWPMFRSYRPGYVPWFLTKKERPYFPRMLAVIDHRSIMGLDFHIFEISSDTSEFRNHFLGFLEKHGALPKEILVGNDETLQIIAPIASLLKINVRSDSELLAMEEFNHAMFDFFGA